MQRKLTFCKFVIEKMQYITPHNLEFGEKLLENSGDNRKDFLYSENVYLMY